MGLFEKSQCLNYTKIGKGSVQNIQRDDRNNI